MLQGMMGATTTLLWSFVLLLLFLYTASLVFRETLGPESSGVTAGAPKSKQLVEASFLNVPRSMMTTFRCAFGDCTDPHGTPLLEQISTVSLFLAYIYAGFLFVAIIGFFNVISAIFVETSLASAEQLQCQKRRMNLEDNEIWSTNVMLLLTALHSGLANHDEEGLDLLEPGICTPQQADAILCSNFPRKVLDHAIAEDKMVIQALRNLDIDEQDYTKLSDILDPDQSGEISVVELVDGLKRLRGDARRSDIITVDLMVRSLHERIEDMLSIFQAHMSQTGF